MSQSTPDSGRSGDERSIAPTDLAPGKVTPGHATKPTARTLGAIPVVGLFLALAGGIVTTGETYEQVQDGHGAAAFDEPVQQWMLAHRSPGLDHAATVVTDLGGKIWMPVLAAVTVALLARWWRTWTPVVVMLVATAGSLVMTTRGKTLTARARPPFDQAVPPLETSASFPSGHTLNTVVITTIVGYLVLLYVRSRAGRTVSCVGLAVFAILVACSRVYLGHHWLTDVIAGAAIGVAWAGAVILGHWLFVRLRTKDRAPTVRDVAQDHRQSNDLAAPRHTGAE